MNLSIDHFDDAYVERMSSTSCPNCRAKERLGTLLTRFENDHLSMQFEAVERHRQVILYPEGSATDQAETLAWIKEWVAQRGPAGIELIERALCGCHLTTGGEAFDYLVGNICGWGDKDTSEQKQARGAPQAPKKGRPA
jgi:hypothetical protein